MQKESNILIPLHVLLLLHIYLGLVLNNHIIDSFSLGDVTSFGKNDVST